MLTEPTLDRLRALRLGAMADAYRTQLQDPAIGTLSFDERVGLLVDAEHLSRDNRKLARRLTEAKLRIPNACLEDLDYAPRRELDRALIRQLATGRWIAEHRNVLITGATGVGKTYLACALGQHACRQGHRAIYRRLPRFFQELALARADGSYTTMLARLARVDVLILDDWGLAAVTDIQRQDLLEVMEDRDATRSTIITSQLPRDQWHAYLGDPTIADAVLDRLVHNAYPITLKGPSRRLRLGESGCDVWTLARIAGHSSIAISSRYVHPSGDAVLTAMSRLGGHNSGHTEEKPERGQVEVRLLTDGEIKS